MIIIEGRLLTPLPALIDPHVHFRVPGGEHKRIGRQPPSQLCVEA